MKEEKKIIIYQVFTRLFGNDNNHCVHNGDMAANGCGKMADFTLKALKKIKELGATHIWYTGIIEHATQTDYRRYNIRPDHPAVVKGKAGSPYAIKDYYDVDPDLASDVPGRMKEFENLVQRSHRSGLKVIIDFVPNHVARQYYSDAQPDGISELGGNDDNTLSFSPYNNFYYIPQAELRAQFDMKGSAAEPYQEFPAKATGNNRFDATPGINDWYETIKLNYGVDYQNGGTCHFSPIPDTWFKMLDILLFWASKKIDGFRCDMAEMVPVDFWEWAIPQVKAVYPGLIFIAEVYNPNEYRNYLMRGRFDYLYDKVGLYDTLRNVTCGYGSATEITHCWQHVDDIQQHMLNFLENHDEQRIASDFFAGNPRKGIPALIVSACMNTNPMMIYFGQEFGEAGMDNEGFSGRDGRTTIFDYWSVDTIRRWRNEGKFDGKMLTDDRKQLYAVYKKILTLCNSEKAISQGAFFDLMYANINGWRFNEHKQYAFIRKYSNELLLFVVNFDGQPVDVAVNIPSHAFNFLQIPPMESYQTVDLLTGMEEEICILPYKPTNVQVGAYNGKILKITFATELRGENEKGKIEE
ncbi:glycosidase [gut metagenome]|uniref:Glycosidase n=1 Tax=gut metagenome TaxID=749906 RepID=J9C6D7_9ZZZZ